MNFKRGIVKFSLSQKPFLFRCSLLKFSNSQNHYFGMVNSQSFCEESNGKFCFGRSQYNQILFTYIFINNFFWYIIRSLTFKKVGIKPYQSVAQIEFTNGMRLMDTYDFYLIWVRSVYNQSRESVR